MSIIKCREYEIKYKRNQNSRFFVLGVIIIFLIALSFKVGVVGVSLRDIYLYFFQKGIGTNDAILDIRLTRILLAISAGAALSVSGAIFQPLFRNPMADPYLLGSSAGASLAVALFYLISRELGFSAYSLMPLAGFLGAFLTSLLVISIARSEKRISVSMLLLVGIAASFFLSAFVPVVMVIAQKDLYSILFFLMGSTQGKNITDAIFFIFIVIASLIFLVIFARYVDYFQLGEERALQLGVDTEKKKLLLLIAASLLTGTSVAFTGIVGFVGLVVPHLARLLFSTSGKRYLLSSAMLGAAVLLTADLISRIAMQPRELPIGVVTAAFGAPFFTFVLYRNKGRIP